MTIHWLYLIESECRTLMSDGEGGDVCCFIVFEVQLFVKSNLNQRTMLERSCLYSPHSISTPTQSWGWGGSDK